ALQGGTPDPKLSALFQTLLFTTLPVVYIGMGVFMVGVIASDLAKQVKGHAKKEADAFQAEAEKGWHVLQDAIEAVPDLIAIDNGHFQLMTCNQAFVDVLDMPKNQLVGRSIAEIMDQLQPRLVYGVNGKKIEEGKEIIKALWEGLQNKTTIEFELNDGRAFLMDCGLLRSGVHILTARDVTALNRSTKTLKSILHGQPFPVLVFDKKKETVLFASEAAEKLLGSNIKGTGSAFSNFIQKHHLLSREAASKQVLQETEFMNADNQTFPVLFSTQESVFDGRAAIVMSFIDLSDQKRLESQLKEQREALFQSEKVNALGTLVAGVAHELNNPLTVIMTNTHIVADAVNDPAVTERMQKIEDAVERCSKIVRSFLNVARKDYGDSAPFDLEKCMKEAIDISGYSFRQNDVDISLHIAPDLPAIKGNYNQFYQVFFNLLLNALHAMSSQVRQKLLSITCSYDEVNNIIKVDIVDSGPGVPANIRSKVFDPFFTTKEVGTGTGLGLFIVRSIVEAHDGKIDLMPSQKGAHFRLYLPAWTKNYADAAETETEVDCADCRILIVDDEEEILDALGQILKSQNHDVSSAPNGQKALEVLANEHIDLIISDLRMPEMDGPQLYEKVCSDYPHLSDKTVFMTGDELSQFAQRFLSTANCPVLSKPFSPKKVKELLDTFMQAEAS
ncbi:hybrid sensor histidine kinase/response regulator, partial [Kordiimonas laminariae]|uniref:hybrid sensor histidine kinase/response regulator n=1 Tax=Kordiimonas laminariae TaxID=2917717 RepID=UPI001FF5F961